MDNQTKQAIIENYRNLYLEHRSGPEVAQLSSEGQRYRFEKLAEIGNMTSTRVLDIGCNLGDLYPFLCERYGEMSYTGIDIVPDIITAASHAHPDARFFCCDILSEGFPETFDYVLISGIFNNAMPNGTEFLKHMISFAFEHCNQGIGFNFISTRVNFRDPEMQYHDPLEVLSWCMDKLTPKVSFFHHYNRCDVAVFAYR